MTRVKRRTALVHKSPFRTQDLPLDLVYPILTQLTERRDLYACSLVSRAFNRFATPLLYSSLQSRPTCSKRFIHHPSTTLLQHPHLAKYVRHITETAAIHRGLIHHYHPTVTRDTFQALRLCKNLQSFTWIDECPFSLSPISPTAFIPDPSTSDPILLSFLTLIRTLPLRELTIRTQNDLGELAWLQIIHMTGLKKLSLWCMEGPPRSMLCCWSEMGRTLTHLELGVSAFAYPCSELLSQLPGLRSLRLKGVQSHAIPQILAYLPELESLDIDCVLLSWPSCPQLSTSLPSLASRPGCIYPPPLSPPASPVASPARRSLSPPAVSINTPFAQHHHAHQLPKLRHLTIRTSTVPHTGPNYLWQWIIDLIPSPGLESFTMHTYMLYTGSYLNVPRGFIEDLAKMHAGSLRDVIFEEAELKLEYMGFLCKKLARLESLKCVVSSPDIASLASAISPAKKLQSLKLRVQWTPPPSSLPPIFPASSSSCSSPPSPKSPSPRSTSPESASRRIQLHVPTSIDAPGLPNTIRMHMESQMQMQDFKSPSSNNNGLISRNWSSSVGANLGSVRDLDLRPRVTRSQAGISNANITNSSATTGAPASPDSGLALTLAQGVTTTAVTRSHMHAYAFNPPVFTKQDAEKMMLRSEDSALRTIAIGTKLFTGKWVLRPPWEFTTPPPTPPPTSTTFSVSSSTAAATTRLKFVVEETLTSDGWHT